MDWRRTPRLAALFIAVWLIVQIAVPVSRVVVDDRPDRFRWQMFAKPTSAPSYVVATDAGPVIVEAGEVTAELRADLPFESFVPEHLCRTVAGAVEVEGPSGVHEC